MSSRDEKRTRRLLPIAAAVGVHVALFAILWRLLPGLGGEPRVELTLVEVDDATLKALLHEEAPPPPKPDAAFAPPESEVATPPSIARAVPAARPRIPAGPDESAPTPGARTPADNPLFDARLGLRFGVPGERAPGPEPLLPLPEALARKESGAWDQPPEGAEAAREKIAGLRYQAPDMGYHSGARVLARSESGGLRFVDPSTGQPLPPSKDPKELDGALLGRSSSTLNGAGGGGRDAVMFRDVEGLPPVAKGDDFKPTDDGGYDGAMPGYAARINPDGSIAFDENILSYRQNAAPEVYEKLGIPAADLSQGTFDVTDMMYRIAGVDPYAAAKSCLVDETEEIRVAMRSEHDAQAMSASAVHLRNTLEKVWGDESMFVEERKELLFELWDDCDDGDRGRWARDMVEGFIRRNLPKGSALAFTDLEIARFNARRVSAVPFAPYS